MTKRVTITLTALEIARLVQRVIEVYREYLEDDEEDYVNGIIRCMASIEEISYPMAATALDIIGEFLEEKPPKPLGNKNDAIRLAAYLDADIIGG